MRHRGTALEILAVSPTLAGEPIPEASLTHVELPIHEVSATRVALPTLAACLIRAASLIRGVSSIPAARSIRATPTAICMASPVVTLAGLMRV
jgi:hypothetical protein